MLPGRMISSAGAAGLGCTTETEGTAISVVTMRRLAAAFTRDRIPKARTATTTTAAVKTMNQSRPACRLPVGCGFDGTISTLLSVCLISKVIIASHLFNETYFAGADFFRHPCSRLKNVGTKKR